MKNLKTRTIIIPSKTDRLRLLIARLLNAIHHRTGAKVFREISSKLALGARVKVDGIYYVLTCVSDLLEIAPEYELEVFGRLSGILKPGLVFVDVGAHIGRFSFPIARLLSENGLVIAIEPDPISFKALTMGIRLNGFKNVIGLNIALGEGGGSVLLCRKFVTATSSIVERESCSDLVKVPMKSLDSLVKELNIPRVDIVKIDVEGAELQVLRGAILTFKKFKPHVFVEVRSYNEKGFEELIKNLSYECRSLWESHVDKMLYCYPRGIREESA
jgi:FkbM family methyltransferase